MPLTVKGKVLNNIEFAFPWRMILSGSSESGKTYFARQLIENQNHLFKGQVESVVYYYPCYLNESPVSWHDDLDIPVSYRVGLPSKQDLMELPKNTCVVLDDLYDEAIKTEAIDHLFRVISGKKKICVMIMTQNNFTQGKYGRDIRNSCNFSVLFRNCCDTNINKRITSMAGLSKAFDAASRDQSGKMYPYIFIDQSQQGQLSNYRLYTDIFGRFKKVWSVDGMKGYIVCESDFHTIFETLEGDGKFEGKLKNVDKKRYETEASNSIKGKPQCEDTDDEKETSRKYKRRRNRRFRDFIL